MMREFLSSNLSVPMSSLIRIKFILCRPTFVHYKINLCSVLIKIAKLPARDTEFLYVIISHEMKKRFK